MAPVTHTKGTNEGRASEGDQSLPVACTETVAALGMCTMKPAQRIGAQAAVKGKSVIARSGSGDTGKAGRQETRRQEGCVDGAAALGLCTQKSTQEGK